MAYKKYAYYNKGNKLAIIEENTSNMASANYGKYESPKETITDGLELEYTYMKDYTLTQSEVTSEKMIGWSVDTEGKVVLHFYYSEMYIPAAGMDSVSGPRDFGGAGISLSAGDSIVIKGGTWSGRHIVNYVLKGRIGLTTSFFNNLETPYNEVKNIKMDFTNSGVVDFALGDATAQKNIINNYISNYPSYTGDVFWDEPNIYVAIYDSAVAFNDGIFSLKYYYSNPGSADYAKLFLGRRYWWSTDRREYRDYHITGNSGTALYADIATSANDFVDIHFMQYEQATMYYKLSVMDSEKFELDLTRGQSNAVVYYLKARDAEDKGEMELREYFMRQFNKELEKNASKRHSGIHRVQGFREMR